MQEAAEDLAQEPGRGLHLDDCALPALAHQHDDDEDVAESIDGKGRRHAEDGDDQAADPRPRGARDVPADAGQHQGAGQLRPRQDVDDGGLVGRVAQRRAAVEREGEAEQQPRCHQPEAVDHRQQ